jgi:hypothetical protein
MLNRARLRRDIRAPLDERRLRGGVSIAQSAVTSQPRKVGEIEQVETREPWRWKPRLFRGVRGERRVGPCEAFVLASLLAQVVGVMAPLARLGTCEQQTVAVSRLWGAKSTDVPSMRTTSPHEFSSGVLKAALRQASGLLPFNAHSTPTHLAGTSARSTSTLVLGLERSARARLGHAPKAVDL